MFRFFDLLDAVFGQYEPPADALSFDDASVGENHANVSIGIEADWHNDFGTQANYQPAAEAYNTHRSDDWSTWRDE